MGRCLCLFSLLYVCPCPKQTKIRLKTDLKDFLLSVVERDREIH